MISDVLNLHPEVLSLSEVFSLLGPLALFRKRLSGRAMWALCSRQNPALRVLLSADTIPSEILYPFDDPHARYTTRNVPPILCTMLPHLTPDYENLYDELSTHRAGASPRRRLGRRSTGTCSSGCASTSTAACGWSARAAPCCPCPGCGGSFRRRASCTCTATGATRRCP